MKHKLLDVIRAAIDVPEHGVSEGDVGAIVEVFSDAYEVEFCNAEGETLAMFPMREEQVKAWTGERQPA